MAVCQVLSALVILERNYSYPKLDFESLCKGALFARKYNFRSGQLFIGDTVSPQSCAYGQKRATRDCPMESGYLSPKWLQSLLGLGRASARLKNK